MQQPSRWLEIGLILAVVAAAIPTPDVTREAAPYGGNGVLPNLVSRTVGRSMPMSTSNALQDPSPSPPLDTLFSGGENSLVARSVGHAEGTRTADGQRTPAYYGHVDPGNGVWNLGSFSFQHQSSSPEDADRKQLERLKAQATELRQQAVALNLPLSLEAELNGIDLANQAPLAALGENGYISRLAEAYERQLGGADAIVWARTWAYVDPTTRQLDAPGLGNRLWQVRADQARRRRAIASAMEQMPEALAQ